jgi:hypothetical protein
VCALIGGELRHDAMTGPVAVANERSWWSRPLRAGHVLLLSALLTISVAVPLLLFRDGDINNVASLANILALPVAGYGLLLLERDRRRPGEVRADLRRPWMAPPSDRMVERADVADQLLDALVSPVSGEVGLVTALRGAGGFGKTTLAIWACHRPEVGRRFPGGLLWVTVGQEIRGADLAVRINDLAFALDGQRPAITDPNAAGAELGRLLDGREPVLLVVDDVWDESQLQPFRIGGRRCTRLVTTRIPDLLPATTMSLRVDVMSER